MGILKKTIANSWLILFLSQKGREEFRVIGKAMRSPHNNFILNNKITKIAHEIKCVLMVFNIISKNGYYGISFHLSFILKKCVYVTDDSNREGKEGKIKDCVWGK